MKSTLAAGFLRKWLGAALLCSVAVVGVLPADVALGAAANNTASSDRAIHEDEAVIALAVTEASARIQRLAATDPGAFAAVLRQAFGPRLSPAVERDLVAKAAHGQLPVPGRILFVPADVLPSAAAYAREDGGVIFLSAGYRADAPALAELILHEWGHHLDALLGSGDSPLEEGEVFRLAVDHGGPIPAAQAQRLGGSADGHATIRFQGRTISVECWFWNKIADAINDHVFKPVANIATATVNAVKDVAVGAVKLVGNTAIGLGKAVVGAAQGIASGIVYPFDKNASSKIAANARSTFNDSVGNWKDAGNGALDTLAAPGNLVNKTAAELDKVIPGLPLGTIANLAVSFTPVGPYVAAAKGVADIINVSKQVASGHGNGWDIVGAVGGAALDVGGGVLGRATKGIKGARNLGTVAWTDNPLLKLTKQLGKQPGKLTSYKDAVASYIKKLGPKTKLTNGYVKPNIFKRGLLQPIQDAKKWTLDNWKWTKATPGEIAQGKEWLVEHPKLVKRLERLDKLKTVNTIVRVQDWIPNQGRDKDGKRDNTNKIPWISHANTVAGVPNRIIENFTSSSSNNTPPNNPGTQGSSGAPYAPGNSYTPYPSYNRGPSYTSYNQGPSSVPIYVPFPLYTPGNSNTSGNSNTPDTPSPVAAVPGAPDKPDTPPPANGDPDTPDKPNAPPPPNGDPDTPDKPDAPPTVAGDPETPDAPPQVANGPTSAPPANSDPDTPDAPDPPPTVAGSSAPPVTTDPDTPDAPDASPAVAGSSAPPVTTDPNTPDAPDAPPAVAGGSDAPDAAPPGAGDPTPHVGSDLVDNASLDTSGLTPHEAVPDGNAAGLLDVSDGPQGNPQSAADPGASGSDGSASGSDAMSAGDLAGQLGAQDVPNDQVPSQDDGSPGSNDPGSNDPGSNDPGSNDPGSSDPGSNDPGSSDPGSDSGSSDNSSAGNSCDN